MCFKIYKLHVLEDEIYFIDFWKQNLMDKTVNESEYLTKQTSKGLRVTIKSTIELTNYLLECDFY